MKKFIVIIPLLAGCIVVAPDPTDEPNSCIMPNTNYSETFTEVSGTCGPRNPSQLGIGSDGNIPLGPGVTCQLAQNNGCESDHQCTWASNGCQVSVDSRLTFSLDGSLSGTETAQVQCPDGSYCVSQYKVTGHRQ